MKQEFNWAMDQVRLPPEAEERILRALEKKQSCFRRRSKQWWRLVLAVAAVLALLVGTAIATTYQAGYWGSFSRETPVPGALCGNKAGCRSGSELPSYFGQQSL